MLNGHIIHFQSKRQKSVALSSCEAETIAATSVLSEAVLLQSLLGRILGIEPKLVLCSDSSSSRQLIARKGLGKLDISMLICWIQKIKGLNIKAIAGKGNPADLGTKSLTKDKIRKYVTCLGYVGNFLDQAEGHVKVQRAITSEQSKFDATQVERIVRLVFTAVLVGLGEALSDGRSDDWQGDD